jgi:hypothetical protein
MIRLIFLLPAIVMLARCAPPPPPVGQARADAETLAACRGHANDVYNQTRRDAIYTISSRDTPYSANYTPGLTDRGLAQRFSHENIVRDCVRNTGTETNRSPTEAPAVATP